MIHLNSFTTNQNLNRAQNNSYTDYKTLPCKENRICDYMKIPSRNIKANYLTFEGSINSDIKMPYSIINQNAYKLRGLLAFSDGADRAINFLKENIQGLNFDYAFIESCVDGFADIISDPSTENGIGYQLTINSAGFLGSSTAILHEAYHILQFYYDRNNESVRVLEKIARNNPADHKEIEMYNTFLQQFSDHKLLLFDTNVKSISNEIKESVKNKNQQVIEDLNNNKILNNNRTILTDKFVNWLSKIEDQRLLNYLVAHCDIEIKAHKFCIEQSRLNVVYSGNYVNANKLRDMLSIKLYQDIKHLAQQNLQKNENK